MKGRKNAPKKRVQQKMTGKNPTKGFIGKRLRQMNKRLNKGR